MSSPTPTPQIEERFQQRRLHAQAVCRTPEVTSDNASIVYNTSISSSGRLRFGDLRICLIPKVGSTFLGQLFKAFVESNQKPNKKTKGRRLTEAVFVREPYGRLLSGYFNKGLLRPSRFPKLGKWIMTFSGVMDPSLKWYEKCSVSATFPEFVRYFILSENTGKGRNEHFVPIHDQCWMCTGNYTYIGHLETIREDLEYMLRSVNISVSLNSEEEKKRGFLIGAKFILESEQRYVDKCKNADNFTMLKTLWLSYHVRGLIHDRIDFPLTESQCEFVDKEDFADLASDAMKKSKGKFSSKDQKMKYLRKYYQEVPLADRLALRNIFRRDFQLSGYDPEPSYIFPEFSNT